MKFTYNNCVFILLVSVGIVSLKASSEKSKPEHVEDDTSLENCFKQVTLLQAHLSLSISPAKKVFTMEDCKTAIENIFNYIHPPMPQHLQRPFNLNSDSVNLHSGEYRYQTPTGIGSIIKHQFQNPVHDFQLKYVYPHIVNPISENHDSSISAQSKRLDSAAGLRIPVSNRYDNMQSVHFNERSFKPGQSFLGRFALYSSKPKAINAIDSSKDGAITMDEVSSTGRSPPLKRGGNNWFDVVNKEVAKRRRQTLSINNALMALTDMVMEHGREKLMRNRDSLRYHMLVQG